MCVFNTRSKNSKGEAVHPHIPEKRQLRHTPMAADKLQDLLNSNGNGELETLVRRAQRLGALASALARALPPGLGNDIVAANVKDDGELVGICRSPARAARVRYESPTLLRAASSAGEAVTRVTVRVSHDPPAPPPP
jgi:hypothetical protein